MAASSVPAVKAALLAAIQARPNLATVQTGWAHPGGDILKETIFLGDARFTQEQIAAMRAAPHRHDERYDVPVWVDVLSESNDVQASETRMWALVAEVETALRNDPGLAGLADLRTAIVTGKEPQNYPSDEGWASRCRVSVSVHTQS